jgi:hypothetical protein
MTQLLHVDAHDLRHLQESAAGVLEHHYAEQIKHHRDLYRNAMAEAIERILEVEVARRLGDQELILESKNRAITNLQEADQVKEILEDFERRLAVLKELMDEENGLEDAFAKYFQSDNEENL